MPRALRIEYPGTIYHVMNRGDRREPIFRDDLDRQRFLGTLAEVCTKTDWPREIGFNISSKIGRSLSHGVNKSMRIASDETFRQELLERVQAGAGEHQREDVRRETVEEKARRILREELDALGWDGAALAQRPQGDARKVRRARRLRTETSVTLKWIAAHLHMGTWTTVANRLCHHAAQPDNQQPTRLELVSKVRSDPFTGFWQTRIAPLINRLFQSGPGSPTKQKVTLTDDLSLSSECE
jgi:hypothetical protein